MRWSRSSVNEKWEIEGISNQECSVSYVQVEVVVLIRVPFSSDVVMFSLGLPG